MESRRMVHHTLGIGELALIPVCFWQAFAPSKGLGFTPKALMIASANLVLPLLLRFYVLFVKQSLLGKYKDISKTEYFETTGAD